MYSEPDKHVPHTLGKYESAGSKIFAVTYNIFIPPPNNDMCMSQQGNHIPPKGVRTRCPVGVS